MGGNIAQSVKVIAGKTDIIIGDRDASATATGLVYTAIGRNKADAAQQGCFHAYGTTRTAARSVSITPFTVGADGAVNAQRLAGRQVRPTAAITAIITIGTAGTTRTQINRRQGCTIRRIRTGAVPYAAIAAVGTTGAPTGAGNAAEGNAFIGFFNDTATPEIPLGTHIDQAGFIHIDVVSDDLEAVFVATGMGQNTARKHTEVVIDLQQRIRNHPGFVTDDDSIKNISRRNGQGGECGTDTLAIHNQRAVAFIHTLEEYSAVTARIVGLAAKSTDKRRIHCGHVHIMHGDTSAATAGLVPAAIGADGARPGKRGGHQVDGTAGAAAGIIACTGSAAGGNPSVRHDIDRLDLDASAAVTAPVTISTARTART